MLKEGMGCCPSRSDTLHRSQPAGVRGRHRGRHRETAAKRTVRSKRKERQEPTTEETHSLLAAPEPAQEEIKSRFDVVAFPIQDTYGRQDFFFRERRFLQKEWPVSEDKVRAVEAFIDSRNDQAFRKADVEKLQELGCPWKVIHTLLASQLRHLILWEESLLMQYCILAGNSSAEEMAFGQEAWSKKGLKELLESQEDTSKSLPDEWFSRMTFRGPDKSPVHFPQWVVDKYAAAIQPCQAKFGVTVPVVRGSTFLYGDIFRRDQDLMKHDPYVVICLENDEYAGHIYTWTEPYSVYIYTWTESYSGDQVAQGIRSSIWKNTLGMCSGVPSRVAPKLLEGVRRVAELNSKKTVRIEAPLYSMNSTLTKSGFKLDGQGGLSASSAMRRVADGPVTHLDSFVIHQAPS
jgi:hypothetical protein